ncbi:TetR/AcrR family transcriptional regulator [Actinomadura decatromicini]|uniref:TetR/AcrR family transcriptional regulator n=1 Tax=Actinomadura decatromicini TaxID=2604572 RepID=A0A5D3FHT3_9ACTN|nr:TetR/AcrR family transcriptional regulator [Actinomadura decatromicini]TYK46865.1 TetR/AcrR family transcriptional regulator [Actinomadura decatromicini]
MTQENTAPPADNRRRPGRRPGSRSGDWEAKRRRILDVAADVFFVRGYERGTTKEIAERAGMSQPTIYHYVGSKEVLMSEIARQVDRDFTAALDEALDVPADPATQLRRVIDAFVRSLALNQRTFAVYWKEFRSLPKDVGREVSGHERDFVVRVEEVVRRAQDEGVLPAGHPTRIVSEGILGMMSWMHWWYKPDEFDADQVSRAFCDLIGLPAASED